MGSVKGEPGSCHETRMTSSDGKTEEVSTKVGEDIDAMEKIVPEVVTFPLIKTLEVRVCCVVQCCMCMCVRVRARVCGGSNTISLDHLLPQKEKFCNHI